MPYEDLSGLNKKGEEATWPQIEAIRITTKVGRILDDYEGEEMRLMKQGLKSN